MGKPRIKLSNNGRAVAHGIRDVKREVQARMKARAPELTAQGQGLLYMGLNATIYETAEGLYRRSHDLARGAFFRVGSGNRGILNFQARNDLPYARAVEFGTYAGKVTREVAQSRAAMPGAQPTALVTGRSGQQYMLASLAHTRALIWAMYRTRLDVKAAVIREWNKT